MTLENSITASYNATYKVDATAFERAMQYLMDGIAIGAFPPDLGTELLKFVNDQKAQLITQVVTPRGTVGAK